MMRADWWRVTLSITNNVRLNGATGYITPNDMLAGRQQEIHAERDRKLEEARKQRQIRRQEAFEVQVTHVRRNSAGDGSVQSYVAAGVERCFDTIPGEQRLPSSGIRLFECVPMKPETNGVR
jgi:hypothetical protein